MSIPDEITRIRQNIIDAYDECDSKGATMPATENSDNLATTIASIPSTDVSDTTAVASDVLETKDFYLANGTKTTGAMPDKSNQASSAGSVDLSSGGYIRMFVPTAGYYDTSSRLTASASTYFGTATADQVLSGKTFTSSAGLKATGTMTDYTVSSTTTRKTFTASTSAQNWTIPTGYYDGTNRVTCKAVTNTKLFEENTTSGSATTKTYTTTKAYLAVFVVYHAATYTAPGSSYYTSTVNMASNYGITGTNGGVRLYFGVKSGAVFTAKNNAGYDNQVSMRIYGIS